MRSNNLRLLLQRGGSRRLFIVSIAASFIWVGIIVGSGLVLARVIVAIINKDSSALSLITILAALWAFRALFNSTFETWCSLQASSIKGQIRNEVTSNLDSYSHVPPSVITTLLVKGLNSLDIYLGRFLPQLFFSMVVLTAVIFNMPGGIKLKKAMTNPKITCKKYCIAKLFIHLVIHRSSSMPFVK